MIYTYPYKNAVWIDLKKPTREEIAGLMEKYNISPLAARDLESPTPKPKIENYGNSIYLVLHFPVLKHSHSISNNQEIDFIIGQNFLITTHYDTVDALHRFSKTIERDSVVDKTHTEITGNVLFYKIIKDTYQSLYDELSYINSWIEDIDHKIFAGNERKMVRALSEVSRALLRFKKTVSVDREMFATLQTIAPKSLGSELAYYAHILAEEASKALVIIDSHMDSVTELRETNNSLLGTKQNETMQAISVIALIGLPLSLIISLLQIDTISRPLVGINPHDFWILSGGILGIGILLLSFFKYKKWL